MLPWFSNDDASCGFSLYVVSSLQLHHSKQPEYDELGQQTWLNESNQSKKSTPRPFEEKNIERRSRRLRNDGDDG